MRYVGDPSLHIKGILDVDATVEGMLSGDIGPSAATNDRFGAVTATTTSSGTVVGNESHRGTVSATVTSSGTAAGSEFHFGTILASSTITAATLAKKATSGTAAGSITSSGTAVGNENHLGVVSASSTSDGTIVGTKGSSDNRFGTISGSTSVDAIAIGSRAHSATVSATTTSTGTLTTDPALTGYNAGVDYNSGVTPYPGTEVARTGGGRYGYYDKQPLPEPAPLPPIAKTGRVRGMSLILGHANGRRGHGSPIATAITVHAAIRSRRGSRGMSGTDVLFARAEVRGQDTGPRDHEYLALYAELRQARDDVELLMLL